MEKAKAATKDVAKDIGDVLIYALYPQSGMRFLRWKYGLETPPPETRPKTLEDVKREDALIAKAKAGKLVEKTEIKVPAKGPAARTFNVFVGDEYFKVEVEPEGGPVAYAPPAVYTPSQPAAVPPPPPPPAPHVEAPPPRIERKEAPATYKPAAGETPVLAPIPGTIVRYLVKEGDVVKANAGIVILEAMKMENEIVSPVAGKVKSVNHKPGDKVSGGAVLAIIG